MLTFSTCAHIDTITHTQIHPHIRTDRTNTHTYTHTQAHAHAHVHTHTKKMQIKAHVKQRLGCASAMLHPIGVPALAREALHHPKGDYKRAAL